MPKAKVTREDWEMYQPPGRPFWPTTTRAEGYTYPTWTLRPTQTTTLIPLMSTDHSRVQPARKFITFPDIPHLSFATASVIDMEPHTQSELGRRDLLLKNPEGKVFRLEAQIFKRSALSCGHCNSSSPQKQCIAFSWTGPDPTTGLYPRRDAKGDPREITLDTCRDCLIDGKICDKVDTILDGPYANNVDKSIPFKQRVVRSINEMLGIPTTYAVFTTPMQKAAGVGNSTPPTLKRKAQSSAEQGNSKRQMVKAEPISEPPTPTPAKEPTPPPKTPTPEPESSRRISRPSARAIEAAESDLAVEASPTVYRRALASAGGFQAVKEGSITAQLAAKSPKQAAVRHKKGKAPGRLPVKKVILAVDLSSNAVAGPSTQLSVKNTPGRPKLSVAEKESNKAERAARKSIVAPPLKPVIPPTETVAPIPPPIILPPIPPFAVLRREVYDLSTDIIHKHISPLSKPVLIPGYETAFQPAFDVPGDSYPHNAENLGLVRWVPAADQSTEPFKMGLVKGKAYRKWHRLCGMRPCIPGLPCVFVHWIAPPAVTKDGVTTEQHPYLDACLTCVNAVIKPADRALACSASGHILSGREKGEIENMFDRTSLKHVDKSNKLLCDARIYSSSAATIHSTARKSQTPNKATQSPTVDPLAEVPPASSATPTLVPRPSPTANELALSPLATTGQEEDIELQDPRSSAPLPTPAYTKSFISKLATPAPEPSATIHESDTATPYRSSSTGALDHIDDSNLASATEELGEQSHAHPNPSHQTLVSLEELQLLNTSLTKENARLQDENATTNAALAKARMQISVLRKASEAQGMQRVSNEKKETSARRDAMKRKLEEMEKLAKERSEMINASEKRVLMADLMREEAEEREKGFQARILALRMQLQEKGTS